MFRILCLVFSAALITACSSSDVKQNNAPSVCTLLEQNDDWIAPLLVAERDYGIPIVVQLTLLEFPPRNDADKKVLPRVGSWDEFRLASERWGADPRKIDDAVTFVAWYASMTRQRNELADDAAGEHYLALRLGHGAYHRFERGSLVQLEAEAVRLDRRAQRWQQEIAVCRSRWQESSWFKTLKFW